MGQISRFNGIRSLNFEGNVAQGYSSGEALKTLERFIEEIAPNTIQIEWAGSATRNGMGVAVVGGMLFTTVIGVFIVHALCRIIFDIDFKNESRKIR